MRNLVLRDKAIPIGGAFAGNLRGIAYVCPACGERWGKLSLALVGAYMVCTWPCENHGNQYRRGGSVIRSLIWWDDATPKNLETALRGFSPELLLHEALVAANQLLGKK